MLITGGTLLLLLQTGRLLWAHLLFELAQWWPLLLVGTGLILLTEWAADRYAARNPAVNGPILPRSLGSGTVFALLLLTVVGVFAATVWPAGGRSSFPGAAQGFYSQDLGIFLARLNPYFRRNFFRNTHDYHSEMQAALAPSGRLTVSLTRGAIAVRGSSPDGQVHVSVDQHVSDWQGDPDSVQKREKPHFSGSSTDLMLSATSQDEDAADLTISVPHNSSLVLHTGMGDLSVEEVHGSASLATGQGDLKLTALRGPVHVKANSQDTRLTGHSLSGGLTVEGRIGDITLSDLEEAVVIAGDLFGTTQLSRLQGPLQLTSKFTQISLAGLPGSLSIEGRDELRANKVLGPLTVKTSDRELHLERIQGPTTVTNRNGIVDLSLAAPLAPVHISNANGNVRLAIPDRQPFRIQAQAHNGEIKSSFDLPVTVSNTNSMVDGNHGSGPLIQIDTSNATIDLRKVKSGEQPPAGLTKPPMF